MQPEGFDFEVARQKLEKQLEEVEKHAAQHEARLKDERFMTKADPETRAEVAQRFEDLKAQRKVLTSNCASWKNEPDVRSRQGVKVQSHEHSRWPHNPSVSF